MGKDWLQTLEAGSEVIVSSSGAMSQDSVERVDRVTKTQVIVGGSRYKRDTGRAIGGSVWHSKWLREPNPEEVERISLEQRKRKAVYILKNTEWWDFDLETLENIVSLLREKI